MDNLIAQNYRALLARVVRAARLASRVPDAISTIAVAKKFSADDVAVLLACGHRVFGENRVIEASTKYSTLRATHPDLRVHMVGALQSNKALSAVRLFDAIHSLDRPRLALALADAAQRHGKLPQLFVQVNFGDEAQKGGCAPEALAGFLDLCIREYDLPIAGLMCLPPRAHPPSPYFALLARCAVEHAIPFLSMGMSADFEQAIMLGATHIRVGTALFGNRPSL